MLRPLSASSQPTRANFSHPLLFSVVSVLPLNHNQNLLPRLQRARFHAVS
jgi:hypothetical protein